MAFSGLGALPALQIDDERIASTTPLQAFVSGEQAGIAENQRNLLREVGGQAARGSYLDASATAMRGGDLQTGLSLQRHAIDLRNADRNMAMKAHEFLKDGVHRADTPERWSALIRTTRNIFGDEMVAGYESFESRPRAMTAMQEAELALKQAQAAEAQAKANDPLDALIRQQLQQSMQPQAEQGLLPQSAPAPSVVPRTGVLPIANDVAPQQTGMLPTPPGIILAADDGIMPATDGVTEQPQTEEGTQLPDVEERAAPIDPSRVYTLPGNEIVQTPLGSMSRDKARTLGLALGLKGKGEAGKMLIDAASGGGATMSKVARNRIDTKELDATEQLARLSEIEANIKPEYLTIEGKLNQYAVSWLDSSETLRKSLPPEALRAHADFASWRRKAYNNINLYIKEITGAQMSEAEANRLRKAIPDPEKDGPTAFVAKLKDTTRDARRAIARQRYLRLNGFTGKPWTAMDITAIDGVIDRRGAEIEQELKSKGVDPSALDKEIKSRLATEFGIPI